MVEANGNDTFKDRDANAANPGPLLLERFYKTLKAIMMVGLGRDSFTHY